MKSEGRKNLITNQMTSAEEGVVLFINKMFAI